jgi:hypothetical protein
MPHPYKSAPDRAFWSRAIAKGFDEGSLQASTLLRSDDRVVSAGSCFAANIVPYLEAEGVAYVRTTRPPTTLPEAAESAMSYGAFSAGYGSIYTARQMLQTVKRAYGLWSPRTDRWHTDKGVIDPFRPGLELVAASDREFDALQAQHWERVRRAFAEATVFVFTLGLTEAWEAVEDGAVYPACPGTIAGSFDPERHRFVNFTVSQVVRDLSDAIGILREHNPLLRVILTVSPVPLVATATSQHVLAATIYSKSVLRAAAGEVVAALANVEYFPAYEIITGPQAPAEYFQADRREPSAQGIAAVMRVLFGHGSSLEPARKSGQPVPSLAQEIAVRDCEEAMVER